MTRALRNPLDLTTSLCLCLSSSRLPVCPPLSDELAVPPSEWRLQFVYTNFMVTSFSSASVSCWPTSLIPSTCSLSLFPSPMLPLCLAAAGESVSWVDSSCVELKPASKCPNWRLLCDLSRCYCPRLTPKTMQQLLWLQHCKKSQVRKNLHNNLKIRMIFNLIS